MKHDYEIVIRGQLTCQWGVLFEGLEITCLEDGNTRLAGSLPDQAALYGLLMRLRDLGMELISVGPDDGPRTMDDGR